LIADVPFSPSTTLYQSVDLQTLFTYDVSAAGDYSTFMTVACHRKTYVSSSMALPWLSCTMSSAWLKLEQSHTHISFQSIIDAQRLQSLS
jgi:hypothetical protein